MPSDYANELSSKVGLDVTEWKKGITELTAGTKKIETSFQASAALMDDWSNSSEGLKMRIESLNDELALQKKKLEILKNAYDDVVEKEGATSKAAQELAKKMFQAQGDIKKTTEKLEYYAKAEQEVTNKTAAMAKKLEESGKKIENIGNKIGGVGDKLTLGVTMPIIAAGTAVYKYSSDLTEAENKTESVFGNMSQYIKDWAKDSINKLGMAKSTAYDAVSLFGDMGTSMGLTRKQAADMSTSLVELSADLSSFKNVSLEQSQNALKGIFTGETESLKNLGIIMTETQLKAYAMSKGIATSYSEMSQAEKVQLRYQYTLMNLTLKKRIISYKECDDPTQNSVTVGVFVRDNASLSIETDRIANTANTTANTANATANAANATAQNSVQQGERYSNVSITHTDGFKAVSKDDTLRVMMNGNDCFAVQVKQSNGTWKTVTSAELFGLVAARLATQDSKNSYYGTIGKNSAGNPGLFLMRALSDGTFKEHFSIWPTAGGNTTLDCEGDMIFNCKTGGQFIFNDKNGDKVGISTRQSLIDKNGDVVWLTFKNGLLTGYEE